LSQKHYSNPEPNNSLSFDLALPPKKVFFIGFECCRWPPPHSPVSITHEAIAWFILLHEPQVSPPTSSDNFTGLAGVRCPSGPIFGRYPPPGFSSTSGTQARSSADFFRLRRPSLVLSGHSHRPMCPLSCGNWLVFGHRISLFFNYVFVVLSSSEAEPLKVLRRIFLVLFFFFLAPH